MKTNTRIPVIIDTDIGGDIDDTWALIMALLSPELDVKLVVSATGNTIAKARVIAKILEETGRTDIPVGIGIPSNDNIRSHEVWAKDYQLSAYPGVIYYDGVTAIIDTIMTCNEQVTLVAIGPLPNISAALDREPKITGKARFVGMHGSVHRGYDNSDAISPEYNVLADVASCRRVFNAPWDVTITPLDTCGLVILKGDPYQKVLKCETNSAMTLIDNYKIWMNELPDDTFNKWFGYTGLDKASFFESRSSVLFDTVAIYLAFCEDLLEMKKIGITISEEGYTLIDESAKKINCALAWKDLDAYYHFLAGRLTQSLS